METKRLLQLSGQALTEAEACLLEFKLEFPAIDKLFQNMILALNPPDPSKAFNFKTNKTLNQDLQLLRDLVSKKHKSVFGQKFTVQKLHKAWSQVNSPTDSDDLKKFLHWHIEEIIGKEQSARIKYVVDKLVDVFAKAPMQQKPKEAVIDVQKSNIVNLINLLATDNVSRDDVKTIISSPDAKVQLKKIGEKFAIKLGVIKDEKVKEVFEDIIEALKIEDIDKQAADLVYLVRKPDLKKASIKVLVAACKDLGVRPSEFDSAVNDILEADEDELPTRGVAIPALTPDQQNDGRKPRLTARQQDCWNDFVTALRSGKTSTTTRMLNHPRFGEFITSMLKHASRNVNEDLDTGQLVKDLMTEMVVRHSGQKTSVKKTLDYMIEIAK